MESSKLKIFFFCYGNVYMLRGGRGGRSERNHHVSANTDNKNKRKKEGVKKDSVRI